MLRRERLLLVADASYAHGKAARADVGPPLARGVLQGLLLRLRLAAPPPLPSAAITATRAGGLTCCWVAARCSRRRPAVPLWEVAVGVFWELERVA